MCAGKAGRSCCKVGRPVKHLAAAWHCLRLGTLVTQVGVQKARRLAAQHGLIYVPVHHMEAHALVARIGRPDVAFPFLCLLVSGGHNLLVIAHGVGRYSMLGSTLDDAVGGDVLLRSQH